jgi:hypothetical protein
VEVVNQIGRGAENKQQSPDLEINSYRMLLPFHARMLLTFRAMLLPFRVCHDLPYQR